MTTPGDQLAVDVRAALAKYDAAQPTPIPPDPTPIPPTPTPGPFVPSATALDQLVRVPLSKMVPSSTVSGNLHIKAGQTVTDVHVTGWVYVDGAGASISNSIVDGAIVTQGHDDFRWTHCLIGASIGGNTTWTYSVPAVDGGVGLQSWLKGAHIGAHPPGGTSIDMTEVLITGLKKVIANPDNAHRDGYISNGMNAGKHGSAVRCVIDPLADAGDGQGLSGPAEFFGDYNDIHDVMLDTTFLGQSPSYPLAAGYFPNTTPPKPHNNVTNFVVQHCVIDRRRYGPVYGWRRDPSNKWLDNKDPAGVVIPEP